MKKKQDGREKCSLCGCEFEYTEKDVRGKSLQCVICPNCGKEVWL